MTRKSPTRRKPAPRPELTSRRVLLAGLGAVSLGRKQARASIEDFAANAGTYQARSAEAAHAAGQRVAKFARQAQAKLAPLKQQAIAFARKAEGEFEASVVPVLAKLGVVAAPKRRTRKAPAARKPAARKAAARRG